MRRNKIISCSWMACPILTRFQFLCGMFFKMLVWSLLVSMLRLCSLNIQSLRNKSAHFVCYASSTGADVFAVTETWFSEFDDALMMLIELKRLAAT